MQAVVSRSFGEVRLILAFPFISFTFTDPPDFIFAGLIVFTLLALAARHEARPYPAGWVKTASIAATVLAVVSPLVPMVALYLLAFRGQDLIGHWPQPISDDPKHIGLDDPTYVGVEQTVRRRRSTEYTMAAKEPTTMA